MQHRPTPKTGLELAEHIEMDHERELAAGRALNTREVKAMHSKMHEPGDDHWDHYHGRKKTED